MPYFAGLSVSLSPLISIVTLSSGLTMFKRNLHEKTTVYATTLIPESCEDDAIYADNFNAASL